MESPITLAEVRAAWPDVPTGAGATEATEAASTEVAPAHRDDLILAWACLRGSASALDRLEAVAFEPAAHHLARRGFAGDVIDEAIQQARVRLLVSGPGAGPGLGGYRGRGSLAAFARTTAVRVALDLAAPGRDDGDDALALLASTDPDPDLTYLRAHYAQALGQALAAAWAGLPRHDRFVLDLALRHRLGIDEIARIYRSHRATAARKLASARATLHAATRDALRSQLRVDDPTVDSILRVVTTSLRWQALAPIVADAAG